MKRIVWLATMAACALVCLTAFAGEVLAAQSSSILPEAAKIPAWVPLLATLVAATRTYYSDNTPRWTTLEAKWRKAIIVGLAAVGTMLEQLTNGSATLSSAILTFALLGVPPFVQELLKALGSYSAGTGTSGGASSGTGIRPPAGESMKLAGTLAMHENGRPYWFKPAAVGVALGFCVLMLGACSWFRSNGCQVLRVASDLCNEIIIILPDGTEERVPTSALKGLVMEARAVRVAGMKAGAPDAGADQ